VQPLRALQCQVLAPGQWGQGVASKHRTASRQHPSRPTVRIQQPTCSSCWLLLRPGCCARSRSLDSPGRQHTSSHQATAVQPVDAELVEILALQRRSEQECSVFYREASLAAGCDMMMCYRVTCTAIHPY
jgi:hypothetical protein